MIPLYSCGHLDELDGNTGPGAVHTQLFVSMSVLVLNYVILLWFILVPERTS